MDTKFIAMKSIVTRIVAVLILFSGSLANSLTAQPCYSGYRYRQAIVLSNAGSALKNYQVAHLLNTSSLVSSGKMNSLGKDIRFLSKQGNELKYWIEDGTMNTSTTRLWIKTDSIKGYGLDTIYMFYGNSSATPKSDASATFDVWDDFNGSSLSSVWSGCGSGSYSITGGLLKLNASSNTIQIKAGTAITHPVWIDVLVNSASGSNALIGSVNASGNGYAAGMSSSARTIESVTSSSCVTTTNLQSVATSSSTGEWSFAWGGSGNQKSVWTSGSLNYTSSTYSSTGSFKPFVAVSGTGTLEVDHIRIRQYASNPPSVSTGPVVDMNFTITATYAAPLCEDGTLRLRVDTIVGATYSWVGPNSYSSSLQNPIITGVSTKDAGRYDVTVDIPSGCASKSSSVNVNISPKAKGGSVSGTQTVCSGSNSGVLSLSGHTGNVARWDSSASATGPWYPITNTQLNQTYLNLTQSMYYRAIVTNGNCSLDSSVYAKITVSPPSDGGSLTGSTRVCAGSNSGTISLSGYTGNIVRWEYSENGNLWNSMVNKGTSHQYSNLTKTMYYRAVVQNGNCNVGYSSVAVVEVDLASLGGIAKGDTIVCPDDNTGNIIVSGNRGDVIQWETSLNGTSNWQSLSGTSDTFSYSNLSINTYFRAVIKNGTCPATESTPAFVEMFDKSAAGSISGGSTVCEGSNSGTIKVTGTKGNILKWQYSNNLTSWTDVASTSTSLSWYNLTDSTHYRAIAANKGCKADTSNIESVFVHKESVSGYIAGTDEVCVTGNTVTINLNSFRGDIEKWEYSSTGYAPWTAVNTTSSSISETNLQQSRYYRALVKNGVCPRATSSAFEVKVNAVTNAGTAGPDVKICEGVNFGVISLSGATGDVVKWQKTNSPSSGSWSDISNATTKQDFQNLNDNIWFRAIVQNGACPADTSNNAMVEVSSNTVAGTLSGEAGFCSKTNTGSLTLVNYTGDVQYWEMSENNGDQWTTMPIKTDSYSYTDLNKTTMYRAVIKNGACNLLTTNQLTISIAEPSFAGNIYSSVSEVCENSNFGTIVANDAVGEIKAWEYKTPATNWTTLKNTTKQLSYFNLTEETSYRTIATNSFCKTDTSAVFTMKVSTPTVGGTIVGISQVCVGMSDIQLNITGENGTIQKWEMASDSKGPWIDLAGNVDSVSVIKPQASAFYRVKVMSGACQADYSEIFSLRVDSHTTGGIVTGGMEVCSGSNIGSLQLNNQNGDVIRWESREIGVQNWNAVANTNPSFNYQNITESTEYRAVVKNGVCPDSNSSSTTLLVNPIPTVDIVHGNLCDGSVINFKADATITNGNITGYNWNFSDGFTSQLNQFDKSFLLPGKYTVTLKAFTDKGCEAIHFDDLQVGETPMVFFRITKGLTSETGCLNDTLVFENLTTHSDLSGLDFKWDLGDGTQSTDFKPTKAYSIPGDYTITLDVTSRTGCAESHSSDYTIYEQHKPIAGKDVQVSKGIEVQLSATGSVVYRWTPADKLNDATISNPVAKISETTLFIVTGTDYYGCESKDSVMLTVKDDYKVLPNNVITPDGNGENDVWLIANLESYPDNRVVIFDRWGREIYSKERYENDWGATDKDGRLLMDGTYYYVLEFPEKKIVMKGAITVIKNR
ncbi:MAG: DUF2341 domain-containing protein [Bacteroidetes bacterium]|nr:DUF2341 domain-containing protein [Bacteroidota bacterium]